MKALVIMRLASRLPDWVWGRKALIEICLLYLIVNAMSKVTNRKM